MRTSLPLLFVASLLATSATACSGGNTTSPFGGDSSVTEDAPSDVPGIDPDGDPDATCAGATTCAKQGVECGPIGDGCGGVLQCGDCTAPDICGGAGVAGKCGHNVCKPKTCADLGANCGPVGDGCGGTLDCGTCTGGDTCGGGGVASQCGHGSICTPKTCAGQAVNCGPVGDGCGGTLDCGACTGTETCGGGGIANVCGAPPCKAKTCADLGKDCGPVADGCGGLLNCGTCGLPKTCGGAGAANVCGIPSTCTNLCLKQVSCPTAGVTTTVSGTVYAPNGVDPLPNAIVYVPNGTVLPFTAGVTCDNCGASVSGAPLVKAVTGIDGKFTLKNMPVGTNIPLVVQLGRWRRQVTIPSVASCTNTALPASLTRLPKNKGEGDIPLMAFSTGAVDALECVMRKIGVDDSEFTGPANGGRIHLYTGLSDPNSTYHITGKVWAAGGASPATGQVYEDQLWSTQAALNKYDMVFFPCQADETLLRPASAKQNLLNYANAGGRIFATHFSYIWLYDTAPFSSTAKWHVTQATPVNQPGFIDTSFPKGSALAQWLQLVSTATPKPPLGQIDLVFIRHDHDGPVAPSQSWMNIKYATPSTPTTPVSANVHYTFNTPVGAPAANQCGRVLFDDFHVENTSFASGYNSIFPNECAAGAMTDQEKLLEFMIFDLASCVTPDVPATCTPKTCSQMGVSCGPSGDGCGGVLSCGNCVAPATCGGGGVPSTCGTPTCTKRTCADQNIHCGPAGDGCGGVIQCGACPSGQSCGGGGSPGVCGSAACVPRTCSQQGIECGPAGDGCGAQIDCGTCPSGKTCGGGGVPGKCGAPSCKPRTCAEAGANCGPVGDGCGNIIQCGTCVAPQTCGGDGTPSVCGGSGPR
jgi:hypothetical protein